MTYRDSKGRFAKMPVRAIEEAAEDLVTKLEAALPKPKRPPYIPGHAVVARFAGGSWQIVRGSRTPEGATTVAIFEKLTVREKWDCKSCLIATGQL
jgi:hypothetical protein